MDAARKESTQCPLSSDVCKKSYKHGQIQKNDVINLIKICNTNSYVTFQVPTLNYR